MENLVPGIIMSFREGLEAFLILILVIKFIEKTDNQRFRKNVLAGFGVSVVFSVSLGFGLYVLGNQIQKMDEIGKIWESAVSLLAVGLVTTFIIWMIQHGHQIKNYVEEKASINLSGIGLFFVSFILISREGVEIAIFTFAGHYPIMSILMGIALAVILSLIIFLSLVKIKVGFIFKITLVYLIIQAGYLLGYGIHEGLSAFKALGYISPDSVLLNKVYDLSTGVLNHKEGWLGLPLNVLFGWYSKPEWLQFIIQYLFTAILLSYWFKKNK